MYSFSIFANVRLPIWFLELRFVAFLFKKYFLQKVQNICKVNEHIVKEFCWLKTLLSSKTFCNIVIKLDIPENFEDAKSFIKNESFKSRLIITVCALISTKCIKRVKSFILHNWAKIWLKYCLYYYNAHWGKGWIKILLLGSNWMVTWFITHI